MPITRRPVHLPSGAGRELPNPWGEACAAKVDGTATGGAFAVSELDVDPAWNRPPYIHHVRDELFYVISGSVQASVETAQSPLELSAGSLLFVPRGVLRSLQATGSGARLLLITTPGRRTDADDPEEGIELAEPALPVPATP